MIWVGGEIVPDDALKISVMDRTFEHGLGLFETFRTWNGHATLLPRHVARMTRSAEALGLPLDPLTLPGPEAVAELLEAEGRVGDARLRITLSGGTGLPGSSVAWMISSPLPGDWGVIGGDGTGFALEIASPALDLDWRSPLGRHKTLNYWRRQLEFERNSAREAVVMAEDGALVEGTRTNVFFIRGGILKTAGLGYPILPGVMRSVVLEMAAKLGMATEEFAWGGPGGNRLQQFEQTAKPEWSEADEIFLTNSVRGIVPVARVTFGRDLEAPGPATVRLWRDLRTWLERGGDS